VCLREKISKRSCGAEDNTAKYIFLERVESVTRFNSRETSNITYICARHRRVLYTRNGIRGNNKWGESVGKVLHSTYHNLYSHT